MIEQWQQIENLVHIIENLVHIIENVVHIISVQFSSVSRINFCKASSVSDNKHKAGSRSIKNSTFSSLNSGHNSSTIRLRPKLATS